MTDHVTPLIDAIDRKAPEGISEHRLYCCGPREGAPELAAAVGGAS
jgi:hypothetical protein